MRRIALISFVLLAGIAIAFGDLASGPSIVQAATPSIASVSTTTSTTGVVQLSITGSGFFGAQCTPATGSGALTVAISVSVTASVVSCTQNQVIVTLSACPGSGTQATVTVTNGDGSGSSNPFTFTVNCTPGGNGGAGTTSFTGIQYFVSPTGNDANDCLSVGTACATIAAAVGLTRDRDIVLVFPGTYDVATPIEVPDNIAIETVPATATNATTTTFTLVAPTSLSGASTACTTGQTTKVVLRSVNGQPIFHVTAAGSPVVFPVIFGFILGGTTSFSNPGAIQLDGTSYPDIGCNVIGQEDLPNVIGILLRNADNANIHDNTIHGSTQFPISPVLGPTPPVGGFGIVTSECLGNGHSDDALIFNNLLTLNSNAGLYLCSDGAGGHILVANTIRGNGRGIVLDEANDVIVAANAIQDSYYDGLEILDTSADNIITNNSIESNTGINSSGILLQGNGQLFPLDNVLVSNFLRRNTTNITIVGARRTLIGIDKTVKNDLEGKFGPAGHVYLIDPANVMSADGERTDIVFSLGNPSGMNLNSASPTFGQPTDTVIRSNTIISNGPCDATRGCAIRLTAGVTVNIDATNNEWGVMQNDEIRAEIWDKFHDPALGQVIVAVPGLTILGTPPATPTPFPNAVPPYTYTPTAFNPPPASAANFPASLAAPQNAVAPPPPTAYIDPTTGNYYVQMTVCVTNANNQPVPNDQLMVGLSDSDGDQLRSAQVATSANGCFSGSITAGTDIPPASVSITDPSGAVSNLDVTPGSPPYRPPAGSVAGG